MGDDYRAAYFAFVRRKSNKKLAELKFGQEIREELSAEHQAKKGTPTMGGVLILTAVFLSTLLWARIDSLYLWLALGATTAFGFIGFWDDYIKIVKNEVWV